MHFSDFYYNGKKNLAQVGWGGRGGGGVIGKILMDLSKAYDRLAQDLLIAKLEACGLDNGSLNLLFRLPQF